MKIENWQVAFLDPDPKKKVVVSGELYGSNKFKDGHPISAHISDVKGRVVSTVEGHEYTLGKPSEEYVNGPKRNKGHVPTEEEPIKW